jgi:ribosomal protein S18 acetylase RimI-like enzyme
METTTLNLYLLTPADWSLLRKARLEALLDSPQAFTSSYTRESIWAELKWRQMLNAANWIIARESEKVIGLGKSVGEPGRPEERHVESAWVAPTHRRRGVFRDLLRAIADIERQTGVTDLLLWVLEDNYDAQRAYQALGFEPTGERQYLPAFRRFERRLRLGIPGLLEP